MLHKWKKKLSTFHQDTDGSEVIEMVWTTMMLVCFIMIGLMLLTYVMQLTVVNTATKKVVREIEVTGQATQATMNARFNEMLGSSAQLKDRSVSISNVSFMSGTNIHGDWQMYLHSEPHQSWEHHWSEHRYANRIKGVRNVRMVLGLGLITRRDKCDKK